MSRLCRGAQSWATAVLLTTTFACGPDSPRESVPLAALAPWSVRILEQPSEIECLLFDTRRTVTFDPIASVRGHDITRRASVDVATWSTSFVEHSWKGLAGVDAESPVPDRALRVRRGEAELLFIGSRTGDIIEVDGGLDRNSVARSSPAFKAWWTTLRWP